MKFRIHRINGHSYVYAYDSIYIAHRKTEKISKSLGPISAAGSYLEREKAFNGFVKKTEINKRIAYWLPKILDKKFLDNISLEQLEKLRSDLYRAKKDMGPVAAQLMETGFLVDFIYNSNRLEGSQIPRITIEKAVKEKAKTKGEVGNTLKALVEVERNFTFKTKKLLNLHNILMAHEPKKLGLRKEAVIVGNSEVCEWQKIQDSLNELWEWYKTNKGIMYPPELAFDFYYKFERIHPFQDGNGRTGRLIMNRILQENKFHPIIISWKRKQAQENAFQHRMNGRKEAFYNFMKEEFTKTYEIFIEKIDTALNAEKLSKVFLQPSPHYE